MARDLAWGFIYACIIVSFGAVLFSLGMMAVHEHTRWNEVGERCIDRRLKNVNLLTSKVCAFDSGYGESIRNECRRARAENALSNLQCQTRLFWKESEVNRVYSMYTESHWMLFGLGTAAIVSFVYGFFSWCTRKKEKEEEKENPHYKEQLELQREFNNVMRQNIEAMRKNSLPVLTPTEWGWKQEYPALCEETKDEFVHGKSRKRHRPLVLKRQFTPH